MSYLSLPHKEDLNSEVREILEDAEKRWGYLPNIVRAYALAPEVLHAEDVWSRGVMYRGFLPRKLKEAIATVVSAVNNCNYCRNSHAHAYSLAGGDETAASACLSLDFSGFAEKERKVLGFVSKSVADPTSVSKRDIASLQEYCSAGEIVEIAAVIQQFMGYNWFVTVLGLELEEKNPYRSSRSEPL